MASLTSLRGLFAALLSVVHVCAAAQASTPIEWTLSGDVSTLVKLSAVDGLNRQVDAGVLELSGADLPKQVNVGDTIEAVISLSNGPLEVPASPNQTIVFDLFSNDFISPAPPRMIVSGGFEFWLNGTQVSERIGGCDCFSFFTLSSVSSPGPALRFDEVRVNLHVDFIEWPFPINVEAVSMSYVLTQPVPEPGQWALMVVGLLGLGAFARRQAVRPQP